MDLKTLVCILGIGTAHECPEWRFVFAGVKMESRGLRTGVNCKNDAEKNVSSQAPCEIKICLEFHDVGQLLHEVA